MSNASLPVNIPEGKDLSVAAALFKTQEVRSCLAPKQSKELPNRTIGVRRGQSGSPVEKHFVKSMIQ